jgi:hypothetical protein
MEQEMFDLVTLNKEKKVVRMAMYQDKAQARSREAAGVAGSDLAPDPLYDRVRTGA